MSKVEKFEDLFVWQKAFELSRDIYSITTNEPFARDWGLKDQIRRASVSVMSNIAEGFERYSNPDFARFLAIARGSCAEVKSQLYLAHSLDCISEENFEKLRKLCSLLSGSIGKLRSSLNKTGGRT
ncbi:MAG: four helix bundle protein [Bacteroidales bacterium]|jgi:four helix bundle protein|nr:four helix bundle protein [Bacteroidales bacterium]